jgi:hypothetical protein|tara:strand:- start:564 stop:791 length:228 start_codon:yes stop_codon:yes gene_type:complete
MSDGKLSNLINVIKNQIGVLSFEELRLIKTIKNLRQQREYLLHVLNETTSSVNDNEDINENFEKVIEFPNDQVKF